MVHSLNQVWIQTGGGAKYCTLSAGAGKILDSITPLLFESRFIYTDIQTYTMVIALSALCIEQAHAMRLKTQCAPIEFVPFDNETA